MQRALRIGLTGGIGSGKSTVALLLVGCGATLVDADAIARQLTLSGGAAIPAIRSQFGDEFIAADGAMDRNRMRQLAFSQTSARQRLEAIIHPLVTQESARQGRLAEAAGSPCIVFDIPLLVESGHWRQQLDRVLVVDCRESTQRERVLARESGRPGWTPDAVEKIMAGQARRAQRLAAADTCIYNDGLSIEALGHQVARLAGSFGL